MNLERIGMMSSKYRTKICGRILSLLLLLACFPLLPSFINTPSASAQMSQNAYVVAQHKHINNNVFDFMAYDFLSMDDNVIQDDQTQINDSDSFVNPNLRGAILFCVLLGGLIFVLLCFGILSSRLCVCGFNRYMVLPHSIHAPPYDYREIFEIA